MRGRSGMFGNPGMFGKPGELGNAGVAGTTAEIGGVLIPGPVTPVRGTGRGGGGDAAVPCLISRFAVLTTASRGKRLPAGSVQVV